MDFTEFKEAMKWAAKVVHAIRGIGPAFLYEGDAEFDSNSQKFDEALSWLQDNQGAIDELPLLAEDYLAVSDLNDKLLLALKNIETNLTGKDNVTERWDSSLRYAQSAVADSALSTTSDVRAWLQDKGALIEAAPGLAAENKRLKAENKALNTSNDEKHMVAVNLQREVTLLAGSLESTIRHRDMEFIKKDAEIERLKAEIGGANFETGWLAAENEQLKIEINPASGWTKERYRERCSELWDWLRKAEAERDELLEACVSACDFFDGIVFAVGGPNLQAAQHLTHMRAAIDGASPPQQPVPIEAKP